MKHSGKKLIAILLAGVMTLSVAACGGNSKSDGGSGKDGSKTLKAALIMDGPIDDGGWNADCYNGIQRVQDELGYEIAYSENVAQADYASAIREYASAGYDLIVLPGNQFQDAAKDLYEEFPDTHFAGINFEFTAKNVSAMSFDDLQSGFLAGVFAGLMTKTNSVGYIGGTEIKSIVDAETGMEKGVAYVNPDAKMVSSMTGSWSDVAKGKELALAQISTSNVDVIFGFASACNTGMIAAAKEKGAMYIAEPLDCLDSEPGTIIGSVLLKNSELIVSIADMVSRGIDEGQAITGNVENGVLAYGTFGENVPAEVQDQLAEIVAGLADGSIKVQ